MNEAIRDDVRAQIDAFVEHLRSGFDPGEYVRLADGPRFDAVLAALNAEFTVLQKVFHDYLLTAWANETQIALRETAAGAAAAARSSGGRGE